MASVSRRNCDGFARIFLAFVTEIALQLLVQSPHSTLSMKSALHSIDRFGGPSAKEPVNGNQTESIDSTD